MGAEFKPILTTSNKISGEGAIDYAAGQILFTIDTRQIYIDDNNYNRLSWSYISKYSDGQNELGLLVGNGEENEASGQNSTIVNGSYNVASGDGAVILGGNPESGEQNPLGNTASGDYSLVAGNKNTASGDYAVAAGYKTQATGDYSVALGNNTIASTDNEVVIGKFNATPANACLFVIGNGSDGEHLSNVVEVGTNTININAMLSVLGTITGGLNLDWVASKYYRVGDLIINNLHLYRCNTANSAATFDSSNWDQIT